MFATIRRKGTGGVPVEHTGTGVTLLSHLYYIFSTFCVLVTEVIGFIKMPFIRYSMSYAVNDLVEWSHLPSLRSSFLLSTDGRQKE